MTDPTHAVGAQLGLPQPQGEATGTAPVLTGASGMAMISEMFQRQARRLQSQEQLQAQDKKVVEYAHAQLLVMQSQLQWHASRYQERALHVNKSAQTISRMQAYLQNMEMEREKSVATALELARDVNELRHLMEASQPEKLQTLTTLSDIAMQVRRTRDDSLTHTQTPLFARDTPPVGALAVCVTHALVSLLAWRVCTAGQGSLDARGRRTALGLGQRRRRTRPDRQRQRGQGCRREACGLLEPQQRRPADLGRCGRQDERPARAPRRRVAPLLQVQRLAAALQRLGL